MRNLTFILIVLLIVALACNKNESVDKPSVTSPSPSSVFRTYDNQTFVRTGAGYFKAIFYGDDSLADYIPGTQGIYSIIQNLEGDEKVKAKLLTDYIITRINLTRPEFLDSFGVEITSKETERIYDALVEGGQLVCINNLMNALHYFEDYSSSELTEYIEALPTNIEHQAAMASSLSSETVISTIFDVLLATLNLDNHTNPDVAISMYQENLYAIAESISNMDLETEP